MSTINLPSQLELKRLENIATEKPIAYQKIDEKIFSDGEFVDTSLVPEYTKAKQELTEAFHEFNAYRAKMQALL